MLFRIWRVIDFTFINGRQAHVDIITNSLFQKIALQDFDGEVRPAVDIEQFLDQDCVLLLDEDVAVSQTYLSPVDLVDLLLSRMGLSAVVTLESKSVLFTYDSGLFKLIKIPVSFFLCA